jgi:hypothetical protein
LAVPTITTRKNAMMKRDISSSPGSGNPAIAAHVAAIRQLGKQTIENIVEIGRRLAECKGLVGHKNWGCWLDREFGWSDRAAQRFMRVHELAAKSDKLSDLDLPVSALYLLAAPSTPAPVCDEILERAKTGRVKHAEVKREIAEAKRVSNHKAKGRQQPSRPSSSKTRDGTPPPPLKQAVAFADATNSAGETVKAAVFTPARADEPVWLQARIGELENENQQQRIKVLAMQSEVEEARRALLSSNVYLNATREQRQQFLAGIGVDRLLSDLPADMLVELHERFVAQYRGAKPQRPLNPTEAALAQVAADDDIPSSLLRTAPKKPH